MQFESQDTKQTNKKKTETNKQTKKHPNITSEELGAKTRSQE